MSRSKDLDTIAPDDPILSSTDSKIKDKEDINTDEKINKDLFPKNYSQKIYDILGHSKNSFSSFLVYPKTISFPERNSDEEIYLALRPHWITNLHWIAIAIFMLFVPIFFNYLSFLDFFPTQYRFSITLFWYLFTFIFAFEKFLDWYFDLFLVTSQRLVDINFNNLLNKHFAEAELSMIQDVSSSVKGLLGTFFNYGDVLIQTAAETNQIHFEKVPNPRKIIELLQELRKEEENKGENNV
jgi:hypothetical protein